MGEKTNKRVDIKAILSQPQLKRRMMVNTIMFLQQMEGIDITYEQACQAYDKILAEKRPVKNIK